MRGQGEFRMQRRSAATECSRVLCCTMECYARLFAFLLMSKFKTPKAKAPPTPRAGLPCVILVIGGVIAIGIFIFLVMKYASN